MEWIDRPTERDLHPVAVIIGDFWREVIPAEPDVPAAELAAEIREVPAHHRVLLAVAQEGGEVVGVLELVLDDLPGVDALAWVKYLVVRPDHRRRGIGTALLEAAIERSHREKRTRINSFVAQCHAAGMSFASARGAEPGLVQFQNRLHTAKLDRQLLEGWVTRATERASEYSLVCFDQNCPSEWLAGFAQVISVMNTAPRPEGLGDLAVTGEQVLAQEQAHVRQGGWGWTVCALHRPSGRLVGFTELGGSAHRPWFAIQGDTGVDPAHRNLGLGRWMKAINALRLLDEKPAVDTVDTWNADVNASMLSINSAMGFQGVATWQEWGLQVR